MVLLRSGRVLLGHDVAGDGCNHKAEEIENEAVKDECMRGDVVVIG